MKQLTGSNAIFEVGIRFDLGTFEGFNFRAQSAIERVLTADEVIDWDHDRQGEAEFWPSGDSPEVALIFQHRSSVTASELQHLDRLLDELGGASVENYLRLHYALDVQAGDISSLFGSSVEEYNLHLFIGTNFLDLRREAAFELFELYYPDEYAIWEKSTCDGLIFVEDRFLDSPSWSVEEVNLGDRRALIVAAQ